MQCRRTLWNKPSPEAGQAGQTAHVSAAVTTGQRKSRGIFIPSSDVDGGRRTQDEMENGVKIHAGSRGHATGKTPHLSFVLLLT